LHTADAAESVFRMSSQKQSPQYSSHSVTPTILDRRTTVTVLLRASFDT
jgi:hypothetical protein